MLKQIKTGFVVRPTLNDLTDNKIIKTSYLPEMPKISPLHFEEILAPLS